jgi:phosphopantothenoylcysteine synthetase/decarboxylase
MIIEPKVDSTLACGERGTGAMADIQHIVEGVKKLLKEK